MNVDHVLETLNRWGVEYLLIGGMNFLLRHEPVLTYDIDLWIEDRAENRSRCERALADLEAEWGRTDEDWKPVRLHPSGWLAWQPLFCLISPHGAIDVFRQVAGLDDWRAARSRAERERTASGVAYQGLADIDMLACQFALDEGLRKKDRIAALERAVRQGRTKDA